MLTDTFLAMFGENEAAKNRFFQAKSITENSCSSATDGEGGGEASAHAHAQAHAPAQAASVLQRHVPSVARSVAKVARNARNLGAVAEYLKVMGRLHHQRGVHVSLAPQSCHHFHGTPEKPRQFTTAKSQKISRV